MPQHVHAELAQRIGAGSPMTRTGVASGDVIAAISYAKAGKALVKLTRRIAHFPLGVQLLAEGHAVRHDGVEYRFVRVETWGNWALIVKAHDSAGGHGSGPIAIALAGPASTGGGAGGGAGGGGGGTGGGGLASLGPVPTDPEGLRQPPSPTAPVPLPGGLALLAGALTLLAAAGRRGTARRR